VRIYADISNTIDVSTCFLVKARPSISRQQPCAADNKTRDKSGRQSAFTADSLITETGACAALLGFHTE
jgi:hypothetical protein